ncbi:hypothetical protein GCM10023187_45850 [Nibrella viscosa]|uniref:DUF2911 domain-containing protein n=1 Tax=Nibrella viscosa TaxID=1084524 RepID=A0ABP8KSJ2_9BACT
MKKLSAILVALFLTVSFVYAQGNKPSPAVTAESPSKNIKVKYGQPSKRGRVIFGPEGSTSLEKYGKVWRTGANEATEITFAKDVNFGGKPVKAGSYTLFTIPDEKEWTVILNGQLGQWGAYDYEKHKSKDVASVKVPAKTTNDVAEKLVITPTDNQLTIAWDKTMIAVPIK